MEKSKHRINPKAGKSGYATAGRNTMAASTKGGASGPALALPWVLLKMCETEYTEQEDWNHNRLAGSAALKTSGIHFTNKLIQVHLLGPLVFAKLH